MLFEQIQTFAESQAQRITEGDVDSFIARFELPLPIYSPVGVTVLTSLRQTRRLVEDYFDVVALKGIKSVEPWGIKVLDCTAQRAMIQLCWAYLDENGVCLNKTDARYVLREDPVHPEPLVEMVEYLTLSFTDHVQPQLYAAAVH